MKNIQVVDVNLDKSEMVLQVDHGGKVYAQIVKYDQIIKIHYKEKKVRRWFRTTKVETVEISLKGKDYTLEIRRDKFKGPFATTVEYLEKFAERSNVPIVK
jgi:glutamine cyclotransferase